MRYKRFRPVYQLNMHVRFAGRKETDSSGSSLALSPTRSRSFVGERSSVRVSGLEGCYRVVWGPTKFSIVHVTDMSTIFGKGGDGKVDTV